MHTIELHKLSKVFLVFSHFFSKKYIQKIFLSFCTPEWVGLLMKIKHWGINKLRRSSAFFHETSISLHKFCLFHTNPRKKSHQNWFDLFIHTFFLSPTMRMLSFSYDFRCRPHNPGYFTSWLFWFCEVSLIDEKVANLPNVHPFPMTNQTTTTTIQLLLNPSPFSSSFSS